MNKLMMASKGAFLDYIVSFGQSNINGRNGSAFFDARYIASNDLINIFDIDSNSLVNFFGNSLLAHYPQTNETAQIAWDTLFYHDLTASMNKQIRLVKVTMGGSACGLGWNVANDGYLWLDLKARIIAFKAYATSIGKVARLRLMLCDLKEGDAYTESYSLNYCYDSGGILRGNFVELVDAIKNIAGFENVPIIHTQAMTTQSNPYNTNIITAQNLFNDRYTSSYLLKMNDSTARYPLQDQYHYNTVGTTNVAADNLSVVISNNLLINWSV